MVSRWRYAIFTAAAVLALVLVVADFVLAEFNRSAQIAVNQRQQFINQGIELSRVNEALVRAIAVAAVRNSDPKLKEILTDQGITVSLNPAAPAAPTAAAHGPANSASTHRGYP